jgi:RNA exonuclease 4
MGKRDMYFALDCEMVGIGPEGLDSALARVSIVNWDNEVVLDTYVRVDQPVTDYRTFVSGVTKENIQSKSAMPMERVRSTVANILRGKILIGHALENDLKVMGLSHPLTDIRDTAKYVPFMRSVESKSALRREGYSPLLYPRKLKDLVLEKNGKEIQVMGKSHCPIEDAIAAMDLYKAVRPEWEKAMINELHRLDEVNLVHSEFPGSVYLNGLSSMYFNSPRNVTYPSYFVPPVAHQSGSYDLYAQGSHLCPNYSIQHRSRFQSLVTFENTTIQ